MKNDMYEPSENEGSAIVIDRFKQELIGLALLVAEYNKPDISAKQNVIFSRAIELFRARADEVVDFFGESGKTVILRSIEEVKGKSKPELGIAIDKIKKDFLHLDDLN